MRGHSGAPFSNNTNYVYHNHHHSPAQGVVPPSKIALPKTKVGTAYVAFDSQEVRVLL